MSVALLMTACSAICLSTLPQSVLALILLWVVMAVAGNLLFWSSLVASVRQAGDGSDSGIAFGIEQSSRGVIAAMLSNFLLVLAERHDQHKFLAVLRAMIILAGLSALMVFFLMPPQTAHARHLLGASQPGREAKVPPTERFVWLLAAIIGATYVGNVTTQYFAQFAHDVVGLSVAEAGRLATIAFVMRGCSSILAGRAADSWGKTRVAIVLFSGLIASYLCLALTPLRLLSPATLAVEMGCASGCVFGLTAIYFSLLDEVGLSQEETGTIVGIVSTAGFFPGDVLMGPLAGHVLDAYPSPTGFRLLMYFAALVGVLGLLATVGFRHEVRIRKLG